MTVLLVALLGRRRVPLFGLRGLGHHPWVAVAAIAVLVVLVLVLRRR